MAIGLAPGIAQSILNALCRNVAWTQPAGFFIKLHTGDPGIAGATAAFGDATRVAATFSAAAADGTITTSADTNWTNVTAAGTVSHVSFWSASSAGTFLGSDDLAVARTMAIGDNFTILAGDVDLSLAPVAA
jgi:hypothetical protein